jgi:hypothetical protein
MSQEIKLIRSAISGKRPDRYNINVGEFALNTADGIFYFKRGDDTVQSLFSTNTVIEGDLLLKGNTFLTGSTQFSGSFFTIGPSSFSGSVNISSSLNVLGTSSFTGSINATGSFKAIGTSSFTGSVSVSSSFKVIGTSSFTGSVNITGSVEITGSQVNSGSLRVTDQIYHPVSHQLTTGILSGGIISGSIGGTTISIGSGSGQIISASFIPNDGVEITYKNVNWSSFSNITPDYLNTQPFTYFYIDENGNLQQQPTNFTDQQLRENIILGHVCHINLTNINLITNAQDVAYGTGFRLEELIRVFGPLKKSGLTIGPSGSSMRVSRASGQVFLIGTNYENDALYPDVRTLNAVTASNVCFIYRSGSSFVFDNNNGNFYTSVTSSKYDIGDGTLGTVNNNQWTIQRLFIFPNNPNDIVFYLGTVVYNSFSDATAGLSSEQFTEASITSENAIYLGALISRGGATNLSLTSDAVFFQSGVFRGTGGGGGGGGGASSLDDLTDVTVTSVSTGDLLVYTGGGWENTKQLSGNYGLTGSLTIDGTLSVTGGVSSLPDTTSILDGATTSIKTIDGAGIEAAFFDYMVKTNDGNHKRAGGAIIMWKIADSLVEFTEYSTLDIGNTSNIIIGATISGTDVNVNVTNNSGQTITVKSTVRLL